MSRPKQPGNAYRVFQDVQRHTCIRINAGPSGVDFIPMGSPIDLLHLSNKEFEETYIHVMEDYPVKQAAKSYLNATWLGVTPAAKNHLLYLTGEAHADSAVPLKFEGKESIMTEKAKAEAKSKDKKPAVVKPFPTAASAKAASAVVKPGATPKAEKAPKTAAAPKAEKAPKTAAVEKAKPVKVAAPAKVEKAPKTAAAKPGRLVAEDDKTVYRVADDLKPRRGATGEAVAIATKLGSFDTKKLTASMVKSTKWDEKAARNEIKYCLKAGVFVAA